MACTGGLETQPSKPNLLGLGGVGCVNGDREAAAGSGFTRRREQHRSRQNEQGDQMFSNRLHDDSMSDNLLLLDEFFALE